MKKSISVVLSLILILSSFSAGLMCITTQTRQNNRKRQLDHFWEQMEDFDGEISHRLIVESKNEIDFLNASKVASGYDDTYYLQFESEEDTLAALVYYESQDNIDSVRREKMLETDSMEITDTKCYSAANSNIDDALKLIQTYYTDLPEIRVAVIDTGVENNERFADRIVGGYDSLPNVDYHGSYVAGTVLYNTPDNVKIYSYKAGAGTSIASESAAVAIEKAVSDGCNIINMSFGSEDIDLTLYQAIIKANAKGVILLASAGNDSKNLSVYNQYPAEFLEVLAVGNMGVSKSLDASSNYGTGIFTYATGTNVRSYYRGMDVYWSGTSASTPIVAAVIANMLSVDPDLNVTEIKQHIRNTAMSPNESNTSRDMIDAYAALKSVTGKELEKATLEYTVTENEKTGYSDISFSCDSDTRIYYYLSRVNAGSAVVYPLDTDYFYSHYEYTPGTTVSLDREYILNAVAYSDDKEKSTLYHIAAPVYNENDYNFTSSSKTISYCQLNDREIIVPDNINGFPVIKIGAFCFAGNENAEVIILPETVTEIGEYAFSNCPNLKKVIAPGVTKCGRYAFQNCANLLEVIMPEDDNTYTGMFKNCCSLRIAQLSDNNYFTSYYNKAFYGCDNMLNYFSMSHTYLFDLFTFSGNISYKLTGSNQYFVESPDEILYLWDSYYINKETSKLSLNLFDSTALFDVNSDNIVNAKDYAILKDAAGRNHTE